jgi:leucyl aminopeptidase
MATPRIRISVPTAPSRARHQTLVVPQTIDGGKFPKASAQFGKAAADLLGKLEARSRVGVMDQSLAGSGSYDRVAVLSLGPGDKLDGEAARGAGGSLLKWATDLAVKRITVAVDPLFDGLGVDGVGALCEGLWLGDFRFDHHRRTTDKPPPLIVELVSHRAAARRRIAGRVKTAQHVSAAVNLARELAHEPANVINPVTLAARAKRLAARARLKCRVLDEPRMRKLKMGAMLAVGQGSTSGSRLIVLEHTGSGRGKPVVLVGKAITFDTGGYSLKPPDGMVGMKYDKCGGMAVLAAMQAIAALKIKTPVVGIIAAAENMVSSRAYRPNDIIRAMSGKTVEIISTDAEGRLVLADALTYAQKHYKPRAIADLATLTGGVRVALGTCCAGLMSNNDALCDALIAAGTRTHERLWRLPLWDDYRELIKGDDSDIKNSGGRAAHCITGGIFLKEFVDDAVPWAHLDIASVADVDKPGPYCPKGATGFGVRLLLDYVQNL